VRQRFGEVVVFADDEEYSVIPTEVVRGLCAAATCFVWVYFEAALADAPASARPCASRTIANITMMEPKNLDIAASIRSETTQTEQLWTSLSTTLFGVLFCPWNSGCAQVLGRAIINHSSPSKSAIISP
jgi:hypothetical protein